MANSKKSFFLLLAVSALMLGLFPRFDQGMAAEEGRYPERDIACIVPFVPGGSADVIARAAAPHLRKYLPKPVNVIIQNIGAAGGRVASFQLYDAKPDGYTIGLLEPLIFIVAEAMGELGRRDMMHMTWMWRAASQKYMIAVHPQSPIKSIKDLKGKRVTAAVSQSTLAGTVATLRYLGAEPKAVMYGGGGESCVATMRGDVDLLFMVTSTLMRQVEASGGKLIPIVLFDDKRISIAPQVPTAKELGVDIPEDIMTLLAFDYVYAAPQGLPENARKVLNHAIEKTLVDPEFVEQLKRAKLTTEVLPPEAIEKRLSELSKGIPQYIKAISQAIGK